mmetsp:Transcript_17095/g.37173  ORF Transcript_17095/g.37173 Transcript_17095/m.37173 type:complete len:242 (-) Transcript_17095:155-880(-)
MQASARMRIFLRRQVHLWPLREWWRLRWSFRKRNSIPVRWCIRLLVPFMLPSANSLQLSSTSFVPTAQSEPNRPAFSTSLKIIGLGRRRFCESKGSFGALRTSSMLSSFAQSRFCCRGLPHISHCFWFFLHCWLLCRSPLRGAISFRRVSEKAFVHRRCKIVVKLVDASFVSILRVQHVPFSSSGGRCRGKPCLLYGTCSSRGSARVFLQASVRVCCTLASPTLTLSKRSHLLFQDFVTHP